MENKENGIIKEYTAGELQNHLTQMLKWFHNFCCENDIRYYAIGGTMLGAVRHAGFIPWDDDIDLGVPRTDYDRLISLIGDREYEGFYLETPLSPAAEYRYPYSKLYDTRTTLTENTWPHITRGIFMDIFPLDGLGDSEGESRKRWQAINRRTNLLWARTCALSRRRAFRKNAAIVLMHAVPGFVFRDKRLLRRLDEECREADFDRSRIVGNIFGNWGYREVMPGAVFGEPKIYDFEDTEIYGVQDADAYGNWRELPPEDKRVTHHDYLELDLEKPY